MISLNGSDNDFKKEEEEEVPEEKNEVIASHGENCEWKEQAEKNLNGWKRAIADYQNLQKEMSLRQVEWSNLSQRIILRELLPLIDNLNQVFLHLPKEYESESWFVGLSHIQKQFFDFLKSQQVKKVSTVGEIFNPREHEAISESFDPSRRDHEILQEAQPGYYYGNDLLFPAKVVVNILPKEQEKGDCPQR
jgi:molecular chaperone GrpE